MPIEAAPPSPLPPPPQRGEPAGHADHLRPPWRRPRLWLITGTGLATVALVVSAAALALRPESQPEPAPESEPEPVRMVRDFFAALTDQDPVRALTVAGLDDPPTGEAARFLHPDAISDQWEVRDVTLDSPDLTRTASVWVTLTGPDEAEATSAIFTRQNDDGQWVIPRPFAKARFLRSPLWYVDTNGMRAPAGIDVRETEYLLLPGFYDFYPQPPPGVEAEFEAKLLVPGETTAVVPQSVTLTASGQAAIAGAVEAYVNDCAQSRSLRPHACPFGSDRYSEVGGYSIGWSFDGEVQWTVREHSVVAATPGEDSIVIADRERGAVDLRATVEWVEGSPSGAAQAEPPPEGAVASVTCEIDTSKLEAGFTATGEVTIAIGYQRYAYPDLFPPDESDRPLVTETCRDVTMPTN